MLNTIVRSLLVVLVLSSPSVLSAAPAKPAPEPKVGVLDRDKVWTDYELTKKYSAEFESLVAKKEAQLARWDRNRLLTEEQLTELDALYDKASSTEQDKGRIKALEDEATKLDGELKSLEAKKEPTPEEKKRLEDLQNSSKQKDDTLAKMNEQFRKELEETNAKWSDEVNEKVLAMVKKVAEQRGMTVVLDKKVVLFGGADLTDAVLEQLNKKK